MLAVATDEPEAHLLGVVWQARDRSPDDRLKPGARWWVGPQGGTG